MPLLLLSLFIGAAQAEDCVAVTTLADFLAAAEQGETAFASMDLPGLREAREQGLALIPCLGEHVTPSEAASFHRMMALAAFTTGDEAQVLAEFHAARRLQPGYEIPETVAPEGHPLLDAYARSINADEGELEPTIPPEGGHVNVDGVRGAPRPNGISTLIQVYEADDQLDQTLYLLPGDPLRSFGPLPIDELQRERRRKVFIGATGVSAVAAAVLYGSARASYNSFWNTDDPLPDDELAGQRVQTNSLFYSSLGAAAVGVGLGVTTALVW